MTLNEEIDRQVAAGMCRRGETATGCLLDDGSEVACQTVRECAPSQHVEYALPGVSPNKNIWVWGVDGFTWSGRTEETPVFQPGVGVDSFSGAPNPFINYDLIAYIPPPTYGPGQPPVNYSGPTTTPGGGAATGASPFAPAYGLGLSQDLDTLSRSLYGGSVVSQAQFCVMYARLTGFACDFNNSVEGTKEVAAWLSQLQSEQNARVSVIGNRPLTGNSGAGGGTGGGSAAVPPPGGLDLAGMMPLLLIVIVLFLFLRD